VLGGHLLLWASYATRNQLELARTDALEVLLLTTLLVVLPPVLAGSVYFVFWHSLQHMLRMNTLLGRPATGSWTALGRELGFFLRHAAPLLAVSVAALAVLYRWEWARAAGGPMLISLALLVASVVTLPHAVLVTLALDAARWRKQPPVPVFGRDG
jgi:Brp/Blh family beta-carotene 15,15'-monooxygenase